MAETHDLDKEKILVIFNQKDCNVSDEELEELIDQLEAEIDKPTIITDEQQLDEVMSSDCTLIVIVDHTNCESDDLDRLVMRFASNGSNVILVFAKNFEYEGLHPIAEKYGTQCGWSSSELSEKIDDPISSEPTDSSTAAAKRKDASQVSC